MKNLLLLLALSLSTQLFAAKKTLEFDEKLEVKCYEELKTMGCVDSSGEKMKKCAAQKRSKMTKDCGQLHDIQSAN